jgi:hypothetical protein
LDSNPIRVPSGDHAGPESNAPGTSNTVVRVLPSALNVSIARSVSPVGDFVVANSRVLMSGEMVG